MAADLTKNPDDFEQYGTFTDETELNDDLEFEQEMNDYDTIEDTFDAMDEEDVSLPINSIQAIKALNQELINLRKEIHELKNEIVAVKNTNSSPEVKTDIKKGESESSGFFDSPDEDSITLTFDELDSLDSLVEEETDVESDNPFDDIDTSEIIDTEDDDLNLDEIELLPENEVQPDDILDDTLLGDSSLFIEEDPAFEALSSNEDDEYSQEIPGIDTTKVTELSETEITKLRENNKNHKDEFEEDSADEDIVISKEDFPGSDPFASESEFEIEIEEVHVPESHYDFDIDDVSEDFGLESDDDFTIEEEKAVIADDNDQIEVDIKSPEEIFDNEMDMVIDESISMDEELSDLEDDTLDDDDFSVDEISLEDDEISLEDDEISLEDKISLDSENSDDEFSVDEISLDSENSDDEF
ncbi:MAG: hypothetical protein JXR64_12415, partial [Spirochaetales bacterium]|nr:hypothetical protein [Spirochaetales bacterium]